MGNMLQGSARFDYEGQNYHLILNNRVLLEAEQMLGYSILDVVEEVQQALAAGKNPLLKHMLALVYGGLIAQHPDVTEDLVLNMFVSGDTGFRNAFVEAMQGAQQPAAKAGQVGNGKPKPTKRAGIGKASSKAGVRQGSPRRTSG